MVRYGLISSDEQKLDYVLQLTTQKLLERRLQTRVLKQGLAKSIHHARVLIRQRHIRVGRQLVDVPSFLVRTDSEKHIDFALTSPFGGGRPVRSPSPLPRPHTPWPHPVCRCTGPRRAPSPGQGRRRRRGVKLFRSLLSTNCSHSWLLGYQINKAPPMS